MQLNPLCATALVTGLFVANEMIYRAFPKEHLQVSATVAMVAMPILITSAVFDLGRKIANALPPNPEGFRQFPAVMGGLVENGVI
jgi:hypothetical protein